MGWVVNAMPRPLYLRERPGTHCVGGWVGLRADLRGAKNLAPTGIRSPDHPIRSESESNMKTNLKEVGCEEVSGIELAKNVT